MGRHYDLARQMCNYWANFIKTGNPNGEDVDGSPMPEWFPYTEGTPCDMIFSGQGAVSVTEAESSFHTFPIDAIGRRIKEGDGHGV